MGERQEGRERRSGASPGELQTAVTQHALSLSVGAGRLAAAAAG